MVSVWPDLLIVLKQTGSWTPYSRPSWTNPHTSGEFLASTTEQHHCFSNHYWHLHAPPHGSLVGTGATVSNLSRCGRSARNRQAGGLVKLGTCCPRTMDSDCAPGLHGVTTTSSGRYRCVCVALGSARPSLIVLLLVASGALKHASRRGEIDLDAASYHLAA